MTKAARLILSIGEVLWDVLPTGTRLGGAPFNLAYRATCLGDHSMIVSRVGRDELGAAALARGRDMGMDMSAVQLDESYPTGTVQVSFDQSGAPDYVLVPDVAYDHIEADDCAMRLARDCDCLCLGTVVKRGPISRRTCAQLLEAAPQALKVLDLNLRKQCYTTDLVLESLVRADIVKLNEEEAAELATLFEWSPAG